jgi:hypothetical protein
MKDINRVRVGYVIQTKALLELLAVLGILLFAPAAHVVAATQVEFMALLLGGTAAEFVAGGFLIWAGRSGREKKDNLEVKA